MSKRAQFVTRDSLAHELEEAIVSGKFAVGAKLPSERQLADRYGVSRPVVREALRTLKERRLIDIHAGRGAFVRGVQSSDAVSQMQVLFRRSQVTARDLIEARSALECKAAELAAMRCAPEDAHALRAVLGKLENSADVVEQARLDLTFHFGIARAARNPVVESMLAAVAQPMVELMLRSLIDPNVASEALELHQVILDAIAARDPDCARTAMARHLEVASRFYGDDLDRDVEAVARRALAQRLAPTITLEHVVARAMGGAQIGPNAETSSRQDVSRGPHEVERS